MVNNIQSSVQTQPLAPNLGQRVYEATDIALKAIKQAISKAVSLVGRASIIIKASLTFLFYSVFFWKNKTDELGNAVKSGHLEIVHALLANSQIRDEDRGSALSSAAFRGHLEIVQALLAIGQISDGDRVYAVERAAKGGHLEIVRALLANVQINDGARGEAVRSAASRGHLEIVQTLLENGQVRDHHRGEAVIDAASRGHLEIVLALLTSGQISDEDRIQATGDLISFYRNDELIQFFVNRLIRDGMPINQILAENGLCLKFLKDTRFANDLTLVDTAIRQNPAAREFIGKELKARLTFEALIDKRLARDGLPLEDKTKLDQVSQVLAIMRKNGF